MRQYSNKYKKTRGINPVTLGSNNLMTTIRPVIDTDHSAILDLVTDLSEWVDADARTGIPIDLHHQQDFVAEDCGFT